MDVAEFEQNILKLAFETDVRITTASVAYYLGIPSEDARPMLDELLEQGVLELDIDREGHLYYRVADAAQQQAEEVSRLRRERLEGVEASPGSDDGEGRSRRGSDGHAQVSTQRTKGAAEDLDADLPLASVDDEGETPAVTPKREERSAPDGRSEVRSARETSAPAESSSGATRRDDVDSGAVQKAETSSPKHSPYPNPDEHTSDGRPSRSEAIAGVTRQPAATDASLDTCGHDSPVVTSEASCEPRPFTGSQPVLASCGEESASAGASSNGSNMMQAVSAEPMESSPNQPAAARAQQQTGGQQASAESATQPVPYSREDHLEKPEHQPGMSLLLSLILCGTGQIYNGEVSKGIMMMVLCFLLWFVLLGWVVHIWSIVDSVVVAERINRRSSNTN